MNMSPFESLTDYGTISLTDKLITRANGIEGTTIENFGYDGLGRMTHAEDDDSIVERWYKGLFTVS